MTTSSCERTQELLTENDAAGLPRDEAAHLRECAECARFAQGLAAVDAALGALSGIEPPQTTVDQLLAKVRSESIDGVSHGHESGGEGPTGRARRGSPSSAWQRRFRRVSGWVAAAAVVLLTLNLATDRMGALNQVTRSVRPRSEVYSAKGEASRSAAQVKAGEAEQQGAPAELDAMLDREESYDPGFAADESAPVLAEPAPDQPEAEERSAHGRREAPGTAGGYSRSRRYYGEKELGAAGSGGALAPAAPPPPIVQNAAPFDAPQGATALHVPKEAAIAPPAARPAPVPKAEERAKNEIDPNGIFYRPSQGETATAPLAKRDERPMKSIARDAGGDGAARESELRDSKSAAVDGLRDDSGQVYEKLESDADAGDVADSLEGGAAPKRKADTRLAAPSDTRRQLSRGLEAREDSAEDAFGQSIEHTRSESSVRSAEEGKKRAPERKPSELSRREVSKPLLGKAQQAGAAVLQEAQVEESSVEESVAADKEASADAFKDVREARNNRSKGMAEKPRMRAGAVAGELGVFSGVSPAPVGIDEPNPADDLLASMKRLDGLTFKEAAGYWSNSYIPGDRSIRALHSYLTGLSVSQISGLTGITPDIGGAIRQVAQPFDQPTGGSLGVYLHADEAAVEGETRMLVQVGLQGLNRSRGHRPAMNLALVVDFRDGHARNEQPLLKELLLSMARTQDVGDRFRVHFAGCGPDLDIADPQQFKYGSVVVALQNLEKCGAEGTESRPLETVFEDAVREVTAGDDENQPLGSSAVVLVTSRFLARESDRIAASAHESAKGGAPVSAIVLGAGADLHGIDKVVSAGQGSRRTVLRAEEADTVFRQELNAVSEVVARAVRLRIRLAAGVKLVDVLGSERLDIKQAQQVREAEQAIDRRVAKSMGIAADRGDDEEGIQIVIPAFYQGDSHVILLDVVVPGPGPVADVTARYKDLVQLKNNVARANLSLGSGSAERGQLELNVIKNHLASLLSDRLLAAGTLLRSGRAGEARSELMALRALVHGYLTGGHGFERDADLTRDARALDTLLASLDRSGTSPDAANYLGSVAQFAAYQKTMTNPDRN